MTEVIRDNITRAMEEEEIREEVEQFYTNLYTPAQMDMGAAEELHTIASPSLATCSTKAQADLSHTQRSAKRQSSWARQLTGESVQDPPSTTGTKNDETIQLVTKQWPPVPGWELPTS
ncbi:hypothetical protein DSO57_1015142 [Entomophthora muscae]|uniref:Uncharacterized protein n=1 Tax=Entomophthora muscae TaxID=34485 RepID=A0ACC2UFM9_9FUNG|nr:hypothetical protein DSO57_1015142 [Entomophthora muscae]